MRAPHLLAPLVLGACAMQPGDVDADGRVDCNDLDGTFEAESVRFEAEDGDLIEDFDGRPDVTVDFSFRDSAFTSTLREDGESVTSTGEFFVDDEGMLIVSSPLVPGMAVRGTRFVCVYDFDARELQIVGTTGYTYDALEGPVESQFDATFVGF